MNRPPRKLILFSCLHLLGSPSHHAVHNEYTTQERGRRRMWLGPYLKEFCFSETKNCSFSLSLSLSPSFSPTPQKKTVISLKKRVHRDLNKSENCFSQRAVFHYQNDRSFIISIRAHHKSSDPCKSQPFWRFKLSTKNFVGKLPSPTQEKKMFCWYCFCSQRVCYE